MKRKKIVFLVILSVFMLTISVWAETVQQCQDRVYNTYNAARLKCRDDYEEDTQDRSDCLTRVLNKWLEENAKCILL